MTYRKKVIFVCVYCMTAVIHILPNTEVLYEKIIHINELAVIVKRHERNTN